MKKLLLVCFLVSLLLAMTIGASAQSPYIWNAGTTQEGSNHYTAIGILSETINTYAGKDIFMTPIGYTKSLTGLRGLDQNEVVSMYASSQQLVQIAKGEGPFDPSVYKFTKPFAQMIWMDDEEHFFVIRKEDKNKIKSYSDLANRSVFPNTTGSGTYELVKMMLGPNAINVWDTINQAAFHFEHAADALKLNEVDAIAGNRAGGKLTGFAQETFRRVDSVLLTPTPEELKIIVESCEFLSPTEISPEYYGVDVGLTESAVLPTMSFVYIVDIDMPEEVVYEAIKAAFEHAKEMGESAAIWRKFAQDPLQFNLKYFEKYKKLLGVPIHPGVLRYLRELGVDTKTLGLE